MNPKDELFKKAKEVLPTVEHAMEKEFPDLPPKSETGWDHMQIKEATFSLSMIVPKGEYQNVKPMLSVTFEGQIDFDKGWHMVEAELKKEVVKLQANIAQNTPNMPVNRPVASNEPLETTVMCSKHNSPLKEFTSKKTGKPYMGHYVTSEKKMCFGD